MPPEDDDLDPTDGLDELGDLGDDQDDEQDDDDEQGNGSAGGSGEDWGDDKPPTPAQWRRAQRRLKQFADEKRTARKTAPAKKTAARRPASDPDQQMADELDTERDDARADADRWRNVAITQAAASQILAAGYTGPASGAERLARLIDTEGIEPDRRGRFDLEDEIEELKEEYPELFGAVRETRRTADGRRAVRPPARQQGSTKRDPTRQTSDAMLREAGFPVGGRNRNR